MTVGDTTRGNVVSHQSPMFQEEFPTLKSAEDKKDGKKEDEPPSQVVTKDLPYGPGPSLRPQSKCIFYRLIFICYMHVNYI